MAKKYAVIIALILVVSYFSLTSGSFSVRPAELLSTLFQINPNPQYEILLFDLRLPRVVMAAIIGLGLGIAGAVIQAITRNGLADPEFSESMQEREPGLWLLCSCSKARRK